MPTTTYARPGVFIQENFQPLAVPQGIPGEAKPAFAAVHPRGPLAPTLVSSWTQFTRLYGDFKTPNAGQLPFAVSQFFTNGGSSVFVLRVPNTDATHASLACVDIESSPHTVMQFTALAPGQWGNHIFVEIATARRAGRFNVNVYNGGSTRSFLAETFQDLSIDPADPRYVGSVMSSPIGGSQYVRLVVAFPTGQYVAGQNDPALIAPTHLTGGADGVTAPSLGPSGLPSPDATDGFLVDAITFGFDTLIDQVLAINVPEVDPKNNVGALVDIPTINAIDDWLAVKGDKFLVVDGPKPDLDSLTVPNYNDTVTQEYLDMVQGDSPIDPSTYIAVYAPYLLIKDPSSSTPGAVRWVAPGGAVLGRYGATDINRGEWKSPAGIKDGVLQVVDVEARLTNANLDALNVAQVCAIKLVPGIGFCIFGARTLHPGYPDRYVAVRRMIMKLEHDFRYILAFALFEPNDLKLWKQITAVLQNYLSQLLQAGALGGTSPNDSFQVICDDSINTLATAQAGIVNVKVAVSLLSPAEFIEITLSQFQGQAAQQTTVNTTP